MTVCGMVNIFLGFKFLIELKNKKNKTEPAFIFKKDMDKINNRNDMNDMETDTNEDRKYNSHLNKFIKQINSIKNNSALPILFIITYIGILSNILYLTPKMWLPINEIGIEFAIISIVLIFLGYLISKTLKNSFKSLGFFEFAFGIYFIIIYMFLPPLKNALSAKFNVLNLPNLNFLILFVLIVIISILIGFFLKKSKRFNKYI
jgi:hypothetical protein